MVVGRLYYFLTMSDTASIMREAKSLGVSGDELFKLVSLANERDERAHAREREKAERESMEKEKEREHELAVLKLKSSNNTSTISGPRPSDIKVQIPPFSDGDDIDSYLNRFEKVAKFYGWKAEDYPFHLGTLLKGKALKVYVGLPIEVSEDYQSLKQALLQAFQIDANNYRKQFRGMKAGTDESYVHFLAKLEQVLSRWLVLSDVKKDYDQLFNFMIRDQFIASCSPEVRVYLNERSVGSNAELAKAADLYRNAHYSYKSRSKQGQPSAKSEVAKQPKTEEKSESKRFSHKVRGKCFICGGNDHYKYNCPQKESSSSKSFSVNFVLNADMKPPRVLVDSDGEIRGKRAEVSFDSMCNTVIVHPRFVSGKIPSGPLYTVYDFLGIAHKFPGVQVKIKSKFFCGKVFALVAPVRFTDVLLGTIPGVEVPVYTSKARDGDSKEPVVVSAVTRSMARAENVNSNPKPLTTDMETFADADSFRKTQETCKTLTPYWNMVNENKETAFRGRSVKYEIINKLLYRVCVDSKNKDEVGSKQLLVPKKFRSKVLDVAHEGLLAGHFSHRKTAGKVYRRFFWPGVGKDIENFCRSCEVCQKVTHRGRVKPVPLAKMPIVSEPFSRVAIDIIGPITPRSKRGHKFVLTLIDCATRFPEAVPLKNIDTISVAEGLVEVFSRVGIPKEILSDNGSQFRSDLMSEINKLLSIKAVHSSPYHSQSNGCVERLNGTLKSMLKKTCADHPEEWDRYIPAVLFAYREIPNDSLKFSPFELLYGRNVRGPLTILHEIWSNEELDNDLKLSYNHVLELRNRLERSAEIAAAHAEVSSVRYKEYFDKKAKPRKLSVGDEVLLLLPTNNNKLLMQWKGPYKVTEVRNKVDYVIDVRGKSRLYHINMLKQYYRRSEDETDQAVVSQTTTAPPGFFCNAVSVGVVQTEEPCIEEDIQCFDPSQASELNVNPALSDTQKEDLRKLAEEFPDVISSLPGKTDTVVHSIRLNSHTPVHKKPYPVPYHLKEVFNEEVDNMIKLGVIEPSDSPYCSPVVLVKKDDSYRLCIDYRALNDTTVFDAEPMPTREENLDKFVDAKFISELDLCKGYWQIPMDPESKVYTAFATNHGLMQFTRMPFGLKTACATFVRLMRMVTKDLPNSSCYFDNLVIYSKDWNSHLRHLGDALLRLRKHNLTVGSKKCFLGYSEIKFLGYTLGTNELKPLEDRVQAIQELTLPQTKSQLRSFMGTMNFYRQFIPGFAGLAASLTDLLRKGCPNQIRWTEDLQRNFQALRVTLTASPILRLPDMTKPFSLRTDASMVGLGAVLLQETDGVLLPVSYASRKLLDREKNYSTIEREGLAVVWGIQHFRRYLFGTKFVLQTDHQPLTYIRNMQNDNNRLMRWALILQSYDFRIEYLRGKDNVIADLLSRP